MKIQFIHNEGSNVTKLSNVVNSTISNPRSLDEFDLNIVDLSNSQYWVNYDYDTKSIYKIQDIYNLSKMIENASKTKVLVLFPQNNQFLYGDLHVSKGYKIELKNMLNDLSNIIRKLVYVPYGELIFEPTETRIGESKIKADFYFSNPHEINTRSEKSLKPTTISNESTGVYFSTLKIDSYEQLITFLKEIGLLVDNLAEEPEWMGGIEMFDDRQQLETIQSKELEIQELKNKINTAQEILNKNERLKSILYTQSDSLVEVVFEIFEEILDVDLSEFEDKKIEDISFTIGDMVFIGEIKGITSNVKTPNLSQLDNHYTNFVDKHPEIPEENIYKLLIINHQRKRPLSERDPIDHKQIKLAENKYTSLIIETSELLKLLENYRDRLISRDDIIDLLTKNGLFKI